MTARPILATALITALLASVPGCTFALFDDRTENERDNDDVEGALVVGGLLLTGVIITAVVLSKSGNNDNAATTPVTRPATQPDTYLFAAPGASDEDTRLQRLFVQGHLAARTGNCEATRSIARHLAVSNPMFLERYRADPTIAVCLR